MQVYFLGADTLVQSQPSSTWLAEAARAWPWKAHLLMNAPRAEALSVLQQPGMLVVFCSLVENLPYVVAEASPSVPLVSFRFLESWDKRCVFSQPADSDSRWQIL